MADKLRKEIYMRLTPMTFTTPDGVVQGAGAPYTHAGEPRFGRFELSPERSVA
jgi:hypothetical protein